MSDARKFHIEMDPAKVGSERTEFQSVYNPWHFEVLPHTEKPPWEREKERIHEEIKECTIIPSSILNEGTHVSAAAAEAMRKQAQLNLAQMANLFADQFHQAVWNSFMGEVREKQEPKNRLRGAKEGEVELEPGVYYSEGE